MPARESDPLLPVSAQDTMLNERSPLLRHFRRKDKWSRYTCYALLLLLGGAVGVGIGAAYEHRNHSKEDGPIMVPPVYKLPPPTGLPRNPAYTFSGKHGGVASEDVTCSELGLNILRDLNGTAMDAAVTTTLCIGLLNAFSSGIGGGGFALVSVPEGWAHDGTTAQADGKKEPRVTAIDFRETSPRASHKDMYTKLGRAASQVGGLAVGVPGELRGLEAAHKLYGRVPWRELVMPVAELAKGWQVSRELARRLRIFGAFMLEDATWGAVYAPRGQLLVEGDWVSRPTYAKTLQRIAHDGPEAFYKGEIADDVLQTVKQAGGILSQRDLDEYEARIYPAIKGKFAGQTVYSADAPASGGVLIGMLQILDPILASMNETQCTSANTTHKIIEAMKFAFGARSEVTDPSFARNVTRLADFYSMAWADEKRALITNETHPPGYYGLETEPIEDHGTTHLSIVDQWGGAASVTSTVNLIWGSHVMCPKTGIIMNDEQDDFAVPGQPDAFGLPPSPNNYPAPGKRPLSSTAPTIVHSPSGEVTAVLGGSGGSRIFPSVAQVLISLACGSEIGPAVERERLHDQILPAITTLEVGPEGVDKPWLAELKRRGHNIGQFDINVGASEVQAVHVHKGRIHAASDSRKNGVAAAY